MYYETPMLSFNMDKELQNYLIFLKEFEEAKTKSL